MWNGGEIWVCGGGFGGIGKEQERKGKI